MFTKRGRSAWPRSRKKKRRSQRFNFSLHANLLQRDSVSTIVTNLRLESRPSNPRPNSRGETNGRVKKRKKKEGERERERGDKEERKVFHESDEEKSVAGLGWRAFTPIICIMGGREFRWSSVEAMLGQQDRAFLSTTGWRMIHGRGVDKSANSAVRREKRATGNLF